MRLSALVFAAVLAAGFAASSARAEGVRVATDQAERVHLRGSAADVVIANPALAEVSLIDSRTLVITGKAPGVTSLVVFDSARRILFDGQVVVGASAGQVAMIRGVPEGAAEERVFTCTGVCSPRTAR